MKYLFKKALIPALANHYVSAIAERLVNPGTPIFMLHRFISPNNPDRGYDPARLEQYLKYLRGNGYTFVSVEQIINSLINDQALPTRSVAFTMDDGFEDQATIAAPIFLKQDCPVTIFLISGMLDGELWPWDDQVAYLINNSQKIEFTLELSSHSQTFKLSNNNRRSRCILLIQNMIKSLDAERLDSYMFAISEATEVTLPKSAPPEYKSMSWGQARKLESQGIQFSPHTRSHRILSQLNRTSSHHEIHNSCERLSDELKSPAPIFCYPTGRAEDFSDREIDIIKQEGLIGAVSTEPDFVSRHRDEMNYLYRLPRYSLPDSFEDFVQYSSWIERAKTQIRRK